LSSHSKIDFLETMNLKIIVALLCIFQSTFSIASDCCSSISRMFSCWCKKATPDATSSPDIKKIKGAQQNWLFLCRKLNIPDTIKDELFPHAHHIRWQAEFNPLREATWQEGLPATPRFRSSDGIYRLPDSVFGLKVDNIIVVRRPYKEPFNPSSSPIINRLMPVKDMPSIPCPKPLASHYMLSNTVEKETGDRPQRAIDLLSKDNAQQIRRGCALQALPAAGSTTEFDVTIFDIDWNPPIVDDNLNLGQAHTPPAQETRTLKMWDGKIAKGCE